MNVVVEIKNRRKDLGLTQGDLAEIAGVSLHTLINLESENGNPTLQVLSKVLSAIGLELTITLSKTGDGSDS
jgi:DNA-binding XRE family transcriptional regulator